MTKLTRFSFFIFLISIPFGTRKFIYGFTPSFNEYGSIFLYASDILLVLFLILFFIIRPPAVFRGEALGSGKQSWQLFLTLFLIISALSIFLASYQILAFYNFLHLGLSVLMALTVAHLLRRGILKFKSIMVVIAASAVFQSLVALFQFKFQSSIGLK